MERGEQDKHCYPAGYAEPVVQYLGERDEVGCPVYEEVYANDERLWHTHEDIEVLMRATRLGVVDSKMTGFKGANA